MLTLSLLNNHFNTVLMILQYNVEVNIDLVFVNIFAEKQFRKM